MEETEETYNPHWMDGKQGEIATLRSIRLSYVNMRIVEQGLSKSMSLKGSQA